MRYGLIGTGYWASEVHAAGIVAAPDAELVGVWGRDAAKSAEVASRYDIRAYEDADAMFADVEAVAFAVPPSVQAGLAVRAADAGCHLLLEKPTALEPADAAAVADAVERNGVKSVVFFTWRFMPEVQTWIAEATATGGWVGGQATWLGSIFHPGNPFGESPWRREWGAVWDVGPHALSVVLPLLGEVTEVTAARGPGDTVHATLRHAGGALSTLLMSLTVPEEAAKVEAAVFGASGWSHLDCPPMPSDDADPVHLIGAASQALEHSVRTDTQHACDAAFGRQVVEVLARVQAAVG